jgi:hypothetical protein
LLNSSEAGNSALAFFHLTRPEINSPIFMEIYSPLSKPGFEHLLAQRLLRALKPYMGWSSCWSSLLIDTTNILMKSTEGPDPGCT